MVNAWLTHSLEFILCGIDCFTEDRDREQLLAAAAMHYGLDDILFLIKGRDASPPPAPFAAPRAHQQAPERMVHA